MVFLTAQIKPQDVISILLLERDRSSINDYKKLGYKNIRYSSWTGYKIVASSRAKAFAKYGITNLLNLITGWQIKAAIGLYDIISLMKSLEAYVYPTVNMQNIIATSPRGTEVLIGQNTITKVYSNSARTKLVKTISRTYWIEQMGKFKECPRFVFLNNGLTI